MNRRKFLASIASLPFLSLLKPKPPIKWTVERGTASINPDYAAEQFYKALVRNNRTLTLKEELELIANSVHGAKLRIPPK